MRTLINMFVYMFDSTASGDPPEMPPAQLRLVALLGDLAEYLIELDRSTEEAGAAEVSCEIQTRIEAWLDRTAGQADSQQNAPTGAAAATLLIDRLSELDSKGNFAIMAMEFSTLLAQRGTLRGNPTPGCAQPDCRPARKAQFSGRGIDCSDCGITATHALPPARSGTAPAWSSDCAGYPETICRALGPDQHGAALTPAMIADWERRGLLAACNADSVKSGRPAARSVRRMYLIHDVLRVRNDLESKISSII